MWIYVRIAKVDVGVGVSLVLTPLGNERLIILDVTVRW